MITYHEMEDDVLYSREMDDLLAQISRAAGEKITLRRYCPQYDSPSNVPREKRSALHTALYREAMAACTAGRYTAGACVTAAAAFDKDACFGRYLALWGVPQPRRQMQESTK